MLTSKRAPSNLAAANMAAANMAASSLTARLVVVASTGAALLVACSPLVSQPASLVGIAGLFALGAAAAVWSTPVARHGFWLVLAFAIVALRLGPDHQLTAPAVMFATVMAGAVTASANPQRIAVATSILVVAANQRHSTIAVVVWGALVMVSLLAADRLRTDRVRLGRTNAAQPRTAPLAASALLLLATSLLGTFIANVAPIGDGTGSVGNYFGFHGSLDTNVRRDLSDAVVMRVRSSRPDYWRAATFTSWDGRIWDEAAPEVASITFVDGQRAERFEPLGPLDARDARSEVTEFEIAGGGTDILFSAWQPTALNLVSNGNTADAFDEPLRVTRQSDATLKIGARLGPGAVYRVTTTRVPANAATLARSDPRASILPADIAPFALDGIRSGRTAALAREITADSTSSYDAVMALQTWMSANLEYSLDIPAVPAGGDAVDHLLFEQRKGFCEQIGTSLVVMSRSLGIPARLAVGYVSDEFDHGTGQWIVRERHAHAWAEIWFPGIGWQGFDPTANVPLAGEETPPEAPPSELPWTILALGATCVVALVLYLLVRRTTSRSDEPTSWSLATAARVESLALAHGLEPNPAATLAERVAQLGAGGLPDERLGEIVRLVELAAFAGRPPESLERDWADATLRELANRVPAQQGGLRETRSLSGSRSAASPRGE